MTSPVVKLVSAHEAILDKLLDIVHAAGPLAAAEVTLHFRGRAWTHSRWTYPDYQRADFQGFFTECRQYLRERIRHE